MPHISGVSRHQQSPCAAAAASRSGKDDALRGKVEIINSQSPKVGIPWKETQGKSLARGSPWSQASDCRSFLTKVTLTLLPAFLPVFGHGRDQACPTLEWTQKNIQFLLFSRVWGSTLSLTIAAVMLGMIGHLTGLSKPLLVGKIHAGLGPPHRGTNLAKWSQNHTWTWGFLETKRILQCPFGTMGKRSSSLSIFPERLQLPPKPCALPRH